MTAVFECAERKIFNDTYIYGLFHAVMESATDDSAAITSIILVFTPCIQSFIGYVISLLYSQFRIHTRF